VGEVSSPERKNDIKISNFGGENVSYSTQLIQARINDISACHSWAVINLIWLTRILYTSGYIRYKECTLTKMNWLLLTTIACRNESHASLILAEREKFWTSKLSHKTSSRKQTTEPKILLSSFLGEVISSTDIDWYQLSYIYTIMGCMLFRFFFVYHVYRPRYIHCSLTLYRHRL